MKEAICYALLGRVFNHQVDHLRLMTVTSVKRDSNGSPVMLYGRDRSGVQTSVSMRSAYGDAPRIYQTLEAAESAMAAAIKAADDAREMVGLAEEVWLDAQRKAKLSIQKALSAREIQLADF